MTITAHREAQQRKSAEPAELLIKEARAKTRRRRLRGLLVAVLVLLSSTAGYVVFGATSTPRHTSGGTTTARTRKSTAATASVSLRHPYGLTAAPNGSLYVVDTARDEVLRRLTSGKFEVVAGDGRRGFSGDGARATNAELRLDYFSGIVMSKNGTLYIADSGNNRVRAVLPNGTIETVAGDGRTSNEYGVVSSTPALEASLGDISGLTMGPDGDLYVAATNVVRLTRGTVEPVTNNHVLAQCVRTCISSSRQSGIFDPSQLAFDAMGDLFFSGCGDVGLCELTTNGRYYYLGNLRGDGAAGDVAEAPNGEVVEASREGLIPAVQGKTEVVSTPNDLSHALGRMNGGPLENTFIPGDGLAVGPNGSVYLDTNTGNAFTSVSALVEVQRSGHVIILWMS